MCDDLETTMTDLSAKGAEFVHAPKQTGWGVETAIRVPGAGELGLYQPHHPIAAQPTPPASWRS
jgi:hypothetical protein